MTYYSSVKIYQIRFIVLRGKQKRDVHEYSKSKKIFFVEAKEAIQNDIYVHRIRAKNKSIDDIN